MVPRCRHSSSSLPDDDRAMATTIGLALVALGSELARRRAKRRADELERDKASLSLEIEALSKVAGVSGVLGAKTNSTTGACRAKDDPSGRGDCHLGSTLDSQS